MQLFAAILALAATAFAYQVTEPNNSTGWTTSGPNVVKWTMVNTDASNFTIVLVNESENPTYSQVLNAQVDGSLGSVTVNAPSGGWVTGTGFQVNLVKDDQNLNTIYAQSNQFTIKTPTSSSVSGSGTTLSVSNTAPTVAATTNTGGTATVLNPTTSDIGTSPTGTNGAGNMVVQLKMLGLVALASMLLA